MHDFLILIFLIIIVVGNLVLPVYCQVPCADLNGSACPAGRSGSAHDSCKDCPKGYYQNIAGQAICFPCLAGMFQDQGGKKVCKPCSNDTYIDRLGALSCKECPRNMAPNSEQTSCEKLPWTTASDCKLGECFDDVSVRNDKIVRHECIPCPTGADCHPTELYGEQPTLSALRPLDGFLNYSWAPARSPFAKCPRGHASCRNGTCAAGYDPREAVAPLCSVCVNGYTLQSKKCVQCDLRYYTEKIAVSGGAFVSAILILLFCRVRISKLMKKYWRVLVPVVSILKIQIDFVQIGCSTGIMIPVQWPEIYLNWLDRLNFLQLDILSVLGLNCISDLRSYEASFLAVSFTLFFCASTIGCLYAYVSKSLQTRLSRKAKNKQPGKEDLTHAARILFDTMDVDFGGTIDAAELSAVIRYMQSFRSAKGRGYTTNSKSKQGSRVMKDMRTSVNSKTSVASKHFIVTRQFMITLGGVEIGDSKALHLDKTRFIKAIVAGKLSGNNNKFEWVYHVAKERLLHTYLSTAVQLFLIFHAPISQKLFFYFNTFEINGRSFMIADYSMEIGTARYFRFIPVVVVVGVIFTLGLPCFILYVIVFKHSRELRTPSVLNQYGFLYSRYTKGSELWELHEIIRKLLLCGIIVYLPGKNRAVAAILVCVLSCCSLNFFRPQPKIPVFVVAELAFIATTFKYLAAVLIEIREETSEDSAFGIGVIVIVCDVLVMLAGIGAIFAILKRSFEEMKTLSEENLNVKVLDPAAEQDTQPGFDGDYIMQRKSFYVDKQGVERDSGLSKVLSSTRLASRISHEKSLRVLVHKRTIL